MRCKVDRKVDRVNGGVLMMGSNGQRVLAARRAIKKHSQMTVWLKTRLRQQTTTEDTSRCKTSRCPTPKGKPRSRRAVRVP